jgi:hypothetical protein
VQVPAETNVMVPDEIVQIAVVAEVRETASELVAEAVTE